jgi:hypothetical protein
MKKLTFTIGWADRSSAVVHIKIEQTEPRNGPRPKKRARRKRREGSLPGIADTLAQANHTNGKHQKAVEDLKEFYSRRPLE